MGIMRGVVYVRFRVVPPLAVAFLSGKGRPPAVDLCQTTACRMASRMAMTVSSRRTAQSRVAVSKSTCSIVKVILQVLSFCIYTEEESAETTSSESGEDSDLSLSTRTCQVCGKVFASSNHLSQHAVVHTGDKPFSCAVCRTKFTRLDSLQRHEKVKHQSPAAQEQPLDRTMYTYTFYKDKPHIHSIYYIIMYKQKDRDTAAEFIHVHCPSLCAYGGNCVVR